MEAIGHLTTRQGAVPSGRFVVSHGLGKPQMVTAARQAPELRRLALVDDDHGEDRGSPQQVLGEALVALRSLARTVVDDVGPLGLQDSAAFAFGVEELSRTLDYLQVVAAGQMHRVRQQELASETGWTTGWGAEGPSDSAGGPGTQGEAVGAGVAGGGLTAGIGRAGFREFRNTGEHLRSLLRISAAEARRRLALAENLLPGRTLTGQRVQPRYGEVSEALACGSIASRPATTITMALERVRPLCSPETALDIEHALTMTAVKNDPDFLARIARRSTEAVDQDGAEPGEEALRHLQGAFLRRPKHGLQHLEIFATQDQYEHLLTVMNTATNPRSRIPQEPGPGDNQAGATDGSGSANDFANGMPGGSGDNAGSLDHRTRAQKLLDGLLGACKIALATGALPAAGGQRPQIMATIDYRDLIGELKELPALKAAGRGTGTGSLTFTGPVPAATLRKIACDADIIPVVLGGEGQVLDIGRASRIFPAHIRKAIATRDKGCAFPGCTIPARYGAKPTISTTGPEAVPPAPIMACCSAAITTI